MSDFGALSLVPPLLAIVLAIVTRRPILSLFVGIWSGGIIATGTHGIGQTFDWISGSIGDVFHAQILVFTLLLGSGVALIWRLGGATAVRNWATNRIRTQRTTGLTTWILGILLFFDDYANTAIVGNTMREISDQMRMSREKLSYIVDSTAAPVATIGLSSWVAFQLSMIDEGYESLVNDDDLDVAAGDVPGVFETFVGSIPFNTYSLLAIVMVGVIVLSRRDYGEMLTAERRSWQTGKVNRDDAQPLQEVEEDLREPIEKKPMLRTFFAPIVALVAVTLAGAFWTGYQEWGAEQAEEGAPTTVTEAMNEEGVVQALVDIVGAGDFAAALVWGSFAMVATAIIIGLAYGLFDLGDSVETVLEGFNLMLTAVTVLVLAWSISAVAEDLGTGDYVATVVGDFLPPELLPIVVLFVAAFVAFTMGSSWATMGIVTPIAITVAYNLTGTFELMPVVVGAVFSGAIFGDHTSPISDTSVLSSTFTGADLIDHIRTQIYYATTVMFVVVICYLLYGYFSVPPIVFLPIGFFLLVGLVYALSELDGLRRGVDPKTSAGPQEPPARSAQDRED
ncbi:putative NhaC-type sodium/proton antiporter [Natrialba magadii ATCC 43099]|uniref:NhaC-type sodium/proton antiporter n=1 Tax=Natrialba magadii (strain ATCC 43099 / DSM 3394 / CCM 3739 / CIP 104546 / IAM 13178 / JCM 8861 / NBRC 102185 / NCIMB 2190 / MS3) TaxID=547559 RepID=D3SS40_NATMM|nr:Na+/H+ antiporter NhaC family protein [Natrialba magadii]ADD04766.1 putative NhaC-type sodium/proton antiporter [Natrialba magadii ATCC 43099]